MKTTLKIGEVDGKPVRATYVHQSGSLPELHIAGAANGSWRGSSLGPANYMCEPSVDDVLYWQSLVGLPRDEAQAKRSIAAMRGAMSRAARPYEDYLDEHINCHCGREVTRREIEAIGECTECFESRMMAY